MVANGKKHAKMPKDTLSKNQEKNWFGRQRVTPEQKTKQVEGVFTSVARSYDIMNDAMSAGLHRLWKEQLIDHIRPHKDQKFLDMAGGTGDIAFRLHKATGGKASITVSDINSAMLEVGQDRAIDQGITQLKWQQANAEQLPFLDNEFDVYTIAFGLRNVTHIDDALAEAYRVLRSGGRFFCLEFSHVTEPTLRRFYDFYSFKMIPQMGEWIAKDRLSYQYLVESIRAFPTQKELEKRLKDAGFAFTRHKNLSFGVVAIHEAWKI
jgi:demethylmenaquinone methyltransferase / 2-methoxy-6-polyprenyl-1,4-benzoquinol methylase